MVFLCVWEIRGLFWPLGDRGFNKDVWLFQHPSANIFYTVYTPFSPYNTPYPTSSHTHTHTRKTTFIHCYGILPELTIQKRALNPEVKWPEPRLSPRNGTKTFRSLLRCPGLNSALLQGYLDSLWLQQFKHKKGLIILFLCATD